MPSTITIQFNSVPTDGQYVRLKDGYIDNGLQERFKPLRTGSYQSTLVESNIPATNGNFFSAFNADYNTSDIFTMSFGGANRVIIEHPEEGFFTNGEFVDGTSGAVSLISIVDEPNVVDINITDISFSEALNSCSDISVDITTDVLAVNYKVDGSGAIPNTDNPFSFEWVRGAYINLKVENVEGSTDSSNIQLPKVLSASNVSVDIINSPTGATISIIVVDDDGLELEYSLDDITYQTSNTYSGILEGSYTVYVRDQLGCKVQVDFEVPNYEDSGIGVLSPIADLPSKANSIRFARRLDWGVCSDYKNDENTLSCELPYTQNPRQIYQLFQNCDSPTTQIKSNYENIAVTVIEEDGTETPILTEQKTENIGKKDKRDAIRYNLGNNQTGIYFTSGNTYDFDTDIINGSYTLNGGLPEWGEVGNYLEFGGAWFEIKDILFDENKNAEVLVIDDTYTSIDEAIIVGSIYNIQDYEVYEFTVVMSSFSDRLIQVNITETDSRSGFEDVVFLSEILDIAEEHPNTVEIKYWSDINTDIFFSTGIIMKIRMPIEYIAGIPIDEVRDEQTDTSVYLVNSEVYEADEYHFALVSKQIMRKLVQAISHKYVEMNEVRSVKGEAVQSTPIIGTNLYRVSVQMKKAEAVYTSNGSGEEYVSSSIEVPALIEQTSQGYIKLK